MNKKFLVVFIFIFISFFLCGYVNLEESEKCYQKALQAYNRGDYTQAKENASLAIKHNNKKVENVYLLALIQQKNKEYTASQNTLAKAKIIAPTDPRTYKIMGDNEVYKGNFATAIEYYKKGQQLKGASPDAKKLFDTYINDVIEYQNKIAPANKNANLNYTINLDKKTWELAHFGQDKNSAITEYGLIGEDVVHYKWTKLITVNYYSNNINVNTEGIKKAFIGNIDKYAKSVGAKLVVTDISSKGNEYLFKWTIPSRNESEICRVFEAPSGKFLIHYAHKKPNFSSNELKEAIKILNSVKAI